MFHGKAPLLKVFLPSFLCKSPSASPSPGQGLLFPWKRVFSRNKSAMNAVCYLQGPLVLFCCFKASVVSSALFPAQRFCPTRAVKLARGARGGGSAPGGTAGSPADSRRDQAPSEALKWRGVWPCSESRAGHSGAGSLDPAFSTISE